MVLGMKYILNVFFFSLFRVTFWEGSTEKKSEELEQLIKTSHGCLRNCLITYLIKVTIKYLKYIPMAMQLKRTLPLS